MRDFIDTYKAEEGFYSGTLCPHGDRYAERVNFHNVNRPTEGHVSSVKLHLKQHQTVNFSRNVLQSRLCTELILLMWLGLSQAHPAVPTHLDEESNHYSSCFGGY